MNISGVRPSEGFYSYNSIKLNEIRNQQITAAQQAHEKEQEARASQEAVEEMPLNQNYTSFDYAQEYNPNDSYDYKLHSSDINSLDVEKAISALDRDMVLQQYRYFVGSELSPTIKEMPQENKPDTSLRSGENFIL